MISVSVVIPVYNAEKYLHECLISVTSQTLKNIEIICIDDGSTDKSYDILTEFKNIDSRIIIIKNDHLGVSYSRNCGISNSSGEFICFMDADDLYPDDDVLNELYVCAKNNNVLICGGEMVHFEGYKIKPKGCSKNLKGYYFKKSGIIEYKNYQFDYGYHRFIYNKKFLIENNIYFPRYIRFQDPPFFVFAMIKAKKFYAINKPTYKYRINHKQIIWDLNKINDLLDGILDNMEYAYYYNFYILGKYTNARLKSYEHCIKDNLDIEVKNKIKIFYKIKMKLYKKNKFNFIFDCLINIPCYITYFFLNCIFPQGSRQRDVLKKIKIKKY